MKFRGTFIVLCLSACAIFISSCASLGPVYHKADPPAGKAIIYVYRPAHFAGSAVSYNLWDVTDAITKEKVSIVYDVGKDYPRIDKFEEGLKYGKKLARIVNGSYYAYTVNPGTYYLLVENYAGHMMWKSVEGDDLIHKVNAIAGKRYFLYSHLNFHGRAWIDPVTEAQGEEDIVDCRYVIDEKQ
jgi:hypothetical protein